MSNERKAATEEEIALYDAMERAITNVHAALAKIDAACASAFFPTKTRAISRASPTRWPRRDCRRALHPRSRRGITFKNAIQEKPRGSVK